MIEGITNVVSDDPLEPRATLKRSQPSGQRHAFPLGRLRGMTQQSTSALRGRLASTARVVRDGAEVTVAFGYMVTGDRPTTARAVAFEMGLASAPVVVTGEQLSTAADVYAAVAGADVVARALPAQKLAIVRALQRAGEIVAVTGDGVNLHLDDWMLGIGGGIAAVLPLVPIAFARRSLPLPGER